MPGNLIAKLSDFGLNRHTETVPSPRVRINCGIDGFVLRWFSGRLQRLCKRRNLLQDLICGVMVFVFMKSSRMENYRINANRFSRIFYYF